MGLALLANLTAYDFGYLSVGRLMERTEQTFGSMTTLERYRGHFYNWYDTQSLKPLLPMYISSVDSGNLAGHVMTLRAGLLALPDQAIFSNRVFQGLRDTLAILSDVLGDTAVTHVSALDTELASASQPRPPTLTTAHNLLTGWRRSPLKPLLASIPPPTKTRSDGSTLWLDNVAMRSMI